MTYFGFNAFKGLKSVKFGRNRVLTFQNQLEELHYRKRCCYKFHRKTPVPVLS